MPTSALSFPWRSRAAIARDVDAELAFHLEMRVSELIAAGSRADAAQPPRTRGVRRHRVHARVLPRGRRAHRAPTRAHADRLGGVGAGHALRVAHAAAQSGLRRVSLLTLALAIGANTAIFTVARAVLLEPLPYGDPGALVMIFESWPGHPGDDLPLSPPNFVDYRAQQHASPTSRRSPSAHRHVAARAAPIRSAHHAADVAPNLRGARGAGAARPHLRSGDDTPGNDPQGRALLSLLAARIRRRPRRVGRPFIINGIAYELIGVMPRDFTFGYNEDMWMPLDLSDELANAGDHAQAALDPHRRPPQARRHRSPPRARICRDLAPLAAQYPDANTGHSRC